jgi:large subunit ribosomal protein L9
MKIILNQDVPNLGEMGDAKTVANGFARNFLFPKGFALPFNARTVAVFEKRKAEIEAHKEEKRKASSSLKEKVESEELVLTMPAGANGKLFGAVTSQTIADELYKRGVEMDRKKIDVPDKVIKSAGNYKVIIHLYEKDEAILKVNVVGQEPKKAEHKPVETRRTRRHEERSERRDEETPAEATPAAPAEAPAEGDQA